MEEHIKMDYSLQTAEERNEKVKEILAATPPNKLTPYYLDKLAKYIVEPITKEEKKQKTITTDNQMVTINKREVSLEALTQKLETGTNSGYGEYGLYNILAENDKGIKFTHKKEITQKDLDTIPGLQELHNAIKKIENAAAAASGKKKFLLMQQLKEMRQDQYILKNDFKKPIYTKGTIKALARINLCGNEWIDPDGSVKTDARINLYTPAHVIALLCNYSSLKEETWDKFDSDMRYLLMDLENLIDSAIKDKYPLYFDLLVYKIDKKTNIEIQKLLYDKHGIWHSVEYLSSLWRNKIPKLICAEAEKKYLEWHFTEKERGVWKRCSHCGQIKLAHNYFFSKNSTSKDGYYSICKECRKQKRKEKIAGTRSEIPNLES